MYETSRKGKRKIKIQPKNSPKFNQEKKTIIFYPMYIFSYISFDRHIFYFYLFFLFKFY